MFQFAKRFASVFATGLLLAGAPAWSVAATTYEVGSDRKSVV